ncbi:MAG: hypothetical protein ABSG27_05020 [Candidatus Acidiferrales bacterium]|jgi:hypothetical protein
MLRRGYRPPPQRRRPGNYIDDFPLVPEPPIYVRPPFVPPPVNPAFTNPPVATLPVPPDNAASIAIASKTIDIAPVESEITPPQPSEPEVTPSDEPPVTVVLVRKKPPQKKRKRKPRRIAPRKPRRKPRRKPDEAVESAPSVPGDPLERHARNCTICNHPKRDAIEEEFLHWHNVYDIADAYHLGWRPIYRHAHALGLFDERDRNLRFSLGHIIEEARRCVPTADAIIRAVRAYTCVNHVGQWIEPPAHVIVSSGSRVAGDPTRVAGPNESAVPDEPRGLPPACDRVALLPDNGCRTETNATD